MCSTGIVEDKSEEVVREILLSLDDLRDSLCKEDVCSSGCTYIFLGSLTRDMHRVGISPSGAKRHSRDYSVDWLREVVSGFSKPGLLLGFRPKNRCSCTLQSRISLVMKGSLDLLDGLPLEDICSPRMKAQEAKRTSSLALRAAWGI